MAIAFMSMANRSEPYFSAPVAQVPRDELYCQLKAFVYLQLNFFEEIYLTPPHPDQWRGSSSVSNRTSFFQYMRHALLREVFQAEKHRSYTGEFVKFLDRHASKLTDGQADDDLF